MHGKYCIVPAWNTFTHNAFFDELCEQNRFIKITPREIYNKKSFVFVNGFLAGLIVIYKVLFAFLIKKGDFRKVKFDSINLGFCINERVISRSKLGNPSLPLILKNSFIVGFKYIILKKFLTENKVGLILAGDEAYPDFSILLQLADLRKIKNKVIKGGPKAYICKFESRILSAYPDKKIYKRLLKGIDKKSILKYEKILKKRLANNRTDLYYMNSKFRKSKFKIEELKQKAIWIYQHDFFDSPGIYGGNLFVNHYQWFVKTIKYCKINSINFYIKSHPNNRKSSLQALLRLIDIYDLKENTIFDDLSVTQIKRTRPTAICSVYGSIIPEAAYAGIPVLTAGSNPFETFPISFKATSIKNYFELIKIAYLEKLKIPEKKKVLKTFICGQQFLSHIFQSFDISWDDINEELWSLFSHNEDYPSSFWNRVEINNDPENYHLYCEAKKLIKEKNLDFKSLLN